MIKPKATGRERTIQLAEIEGAYSELMARGQISRAEIRERHSEFNPAYVAALIASLPSIQVLRNPIRLVYRPK